MTIYQMLSYELVNKKQIAKVCKGVEIKDGGGVLLVGDDLIL